MTGKHILAFCPAQGPERFIPVLDVTYDTPQEAIDSGSAVLLADKSPHRAFQVWSMGQTFRIQPQVVAAAA